MLEAFIIETRSKVRSDPHPSPNPSPNPSPSPNPNPKPSRNPSPSPNPNPNRGKALAQTASFAPSAGNGSVVLAVHDLWGGRAMAYEPLDVVPVTPSLHLRLGLRLTPTPTPTLILTR